MPQLDPAGFSPQLVWLAITFVALFLLMWRVTLPKVEDVFALRRERIDGNLLKAEKLKEEAEAALNAYQKAIADSKALAQAELQRTAADIAAKTGAREAEFAKRLNEKTAMAEGRIKAAKAQAMTKVRAIAAELASAMSTKLTGEGADSTRAGQAVDAALKERS
jgi:F-type H+-transporting ATPase subunit b